MCLNEAAGKIFTKLGDLNKCIYIDDCIISPKCLLQLYIKLIERFNVLINQCSKLYKQRLYLARKSMCDIILYENNFVFLRPTYFHTNEHIYYRSLIDLFFQLYNAFVKRHGNLYSMSICTSFRNTVTCTLHLHAQKKILLNSYRCKNASCNGYCRNKPDSDSSHSNMNSEKIDEMNWCYGCIPNKNEGQSNLIMYANELGFECKFDKSVTILHYILFGRDDKCHAFFCCPINLLNAEWYNLFQVWILLKNSQISNNIEKLNRYTNICSSNINNNNNNNDKCKSTL